MDNPNFLAITLASVVSILVVIILLKVFGGTVSRRWNNHRAETVERWESEGIEFTRGPTASQFGGLESMGIKHMVRGMGLVMLTENDFRVTCLSHTTAWWTLNFKQIKGVSIRPGFMGKTARKSPFIVIRFKKDGQADKLAFQVKETDNWATAVAQAANVKLKPQDKD